MSKIEVRFSNIEKMNTKATKHWYGCSVESDAIKWEGELSVQLVEVSLRKT